MRLLNQRVRRLEHRHPTLGPWILVLGLLQYFVVQVVVASAWPHPYSVTANYISDLGSTACGTTHLSVYVCSPLHGPMNASFIVIGLVLSFGAALIYYAFNRSRASQAVFSLLGITGFGTALVGLVPENVVPALHASIATICLIGFNIGVALTYLIRGLPRSLRLYSLASGLVGLVAMAGIGLGLVTPIGLGGLERLADYTPDLWVITISLYALHRAKFRVISI